MSLLQWKPAYSLGIPSVDMEHREMIRMINEVYASLDDPNDADSIDGVLAEIHARIAAHFALEERLMRQAAYGEYMEHKGSHEELLDQIRSLMDTCAVQDPAAGKEALRRSLSDWFSTHFATFDARLHQRL